MFCSLALLVGCQDSLDWHFLPAGPAGLQIQFPCPAQASTKTVLLVGLSLPGQLYVCSVRSQTFSVLELRGVPPLMQLSVANALKRNAIVALRGELLQSQEFEINSVNPNLADSLDVLIKGQSNYQTVMQRMRIFAIDNRMFVISQIANEAAFVERIAERFVTSVSIQ